MKLYSRILELLLISILLFIAAGCPISRQPKAVPLVLPNRVDDLFDELGFEYASLPEAERELLALRDSVTGFLPRNEMFALLSKDPTTFIYEFRQLQDSTDFYLNVSVGQHLRLYGWPSDDPCGWDNVVQFRDGDNLYVYQGSIFDFSGVKRDTPLTVGPVGDIPRLMQPDGTTAYLMQLNWSETPGIEQCMLIAVKIEGDKLIPMQAFEPDSTATDGRNCSWRAYSTELWQKKSDNNDTSGLYILDLTTQLMYIPETKGVELTDRYNIYNLEDGHFTYAGNDGGYWLHPSIRTFKELIAMFSTRQFLVRLDLMDDGSYRYASWSDEESMRGQPDIILNNGTFNAASDTYTFTNGSYEYHITPHAPSANLIVTQGSDTILIEPRLVQ